MTSQIVKKLPINNQKNSIVRVPFLLKIVLIIVLLINVGLYAQVGVNNTDPKSSLDISASNAASPANTDGILIPRIDAFPSSDPGADQLGMMVFLTTTDGTDEPGFYYWNHPTTTWEWANRLKKIDDLSDGKSDSDGSQDGSSVFLGEGSGASDDSSDNKNVGLGYNSLNAVTSGGNNTAIGNEALLLNTGSNNVGIGTGALKNNTTGGTNTAIGYQALNATSTQSGLTAIGYQALALNDTGSNNIAIGAYALDANLSGNNNMAIGYFSLSKQIIGNGNTGIGSGTLANHEGVAWSNGNTAIGSQTMNKLTAGKGNTSVGSESMRYGTSGSYNTAIGRFAGFHAGRDNTQYDNNTLIGNIAGFGVTGSNNVFIGADAGGYFDEGADGLPGDTADNVFTEGSDNIFIGYQAGKYLAAAASSFSDKLIIENSNSATHLIHGDFSTGEVGINWNSGTALPNTLSVNGNASKSSSGSWLANSDRRLKKNIETISPQNALEKITSLRGVTYEWNDTKTGIDRPTTTQYGFIAQELMEVFPENVTKDGLGFYQTAYGDYDALFVQAFKELKNQLNKKDQRISELENQVKLLQEFSERLDALEAKLDLNRKTVQIVSSK